MTNPFPTKFAADAADIAYQANDPITLYIKKDDSIILKETYTPDGSGNIHVRGLARLISQALYGQLGATDQTATGKATFGIYVNTTSAAAWQRDIYSMRLQNPRDPGGSNTVMSAVARRTHHQGSPLLLTMAGEVTAVLYYAGGTLVANQTYGSAGRITTADLQPFADSMPGATQLIVGNQEISIVAPACEDAVEVRFLNRYDMPESITAAYMEEKPSAADDVSQMYGMRTRFDVKSATEYVLKSGPLQLDEADLWQDLLTARRAQVRVHGQWVDILVTKASHTRHRRRHYGSQAEISFQTANPYITI